jgi:hypothetical protein
MIVEVKCFPETVSALGELYTAIGQYLIYRSLLRRANITDPLYLAVPSTAYEGILQEIGMPVVNEVRIKMIVVNLDDEVIKQWLE